VALLFNIGTATGNSIWALVLTVLLLLKENYKCSPSRFAWSWAAANAITYSQTGGVNQCKIL
jgi:hypothetical protein